MKLIVLILANNNNLYLECQKIWKSYMNTCPNISSYFIKYSSNLSDEVLVENDTIFIKGRESYIPGCLDKTIKSIEFLLKTSDFDFIFRTNMSSVVDLNKLNNLLTTCKNDCYGFIGYHNDTKFASGAGMLFSRKLCNYLINNNKFLHYELLDDLAIGSFLQSRNIEIFPLTRFEVYDYENNINDISKDLIKDYYHFRCKSINNNEIKTLLMMQKIVELIY